MAGRSSALETAPAFPLGGEAVLPARPNPLVALGRLGIRKPLGAIGVVIILIMGVMAAFAPIVERYPPDQPFQRVNPHHDPNDPLTGFETQVDASAPPTWEHWFGTDNAGRDMWSRIVWGTRRSLGVGVTALAIATGFGAVLGILSAYFSGRFDLIMQRFLDAIQAFPALLILILIVSISEPRIENLILGLGFVGIPLVSRIVRGTVLSLREMSYVEAARVVGASDLRIMARHVLPNTIAPIIVAFSIGLGTVIIAEASLSFLGLAPPGVSWGIMLSEGQNFVQSSPWQAVFSGLAITLAVFGFNVAGDALRDVLDPRLRV